MAKLLLLALVIGAPLVQARMPGMVTTTPIPTSPATAPTFKDLGLGMCRDNQKRVLARGSTTATNADARAACAAQADCLGFDIMLANAGSASYTSYYCLNRGGICDDYNGSGATAITTTTGSSASGTRCFKRADAPVRCSSPAGTCAKCIKRGYFKSGFTRATCVDKMNALGGDTFNYKESDGSCHVMKCGSNANFMYLTELGECEVYSTFCKACSDGNPKSKTCAYYKRSGYCDPDKKESNTARYFGYKGDARDNCQKTCGLCQQPGWVLGAYGRDTCPSGTEKITKWYECKKAAAPLENVNSYAKYKGTDASWSGGPAKGYPHGKYPSGCYQYFGGAGTGVWFGTANPSGRNVRAILICKVHGVTTTASTTTTMTTTTTMATMATTTTTTTTTTATTTRTTTTTTMTTTTTTITTVTTTTTTTRIKTTATTMTTTMTTTTTTTTTATTTTTPATTTTTTTTTMTATTMPATTMSTTTMAAAIEKTTTTVTPKTTTIAMAASTSMTSTTAATTMTTTQTTMAVTTTTASARAVSEHTIFAAIEIADPTTFDVEVFAKAMTEAYDIYQPNVQAVITGFSVSVSYEFSTAVVAEKLAAAIAASVGVDQDDVEVKFTRRLAINTGPHFIVKADIETADATIAKAVKTKSASAEALKLALAKIDVNTEPLVKAPPSVTVRTQTVVITSLGSMLQVLDSAKLAEVGRSVGGAVVITLDMRASTTTVIMASTSADSAPTTTALPSTGTTSQGSSAPASTSKLFLSVSSGVDLVAGPCVAAVALAFHLTCF